MVKLDFIKPHPNPTLHTTEGWTIPPLDGSLSVPELYDFHYEHNADHPVFVYANPSGEGLTHIRYSELIPAAHRAGWQITKIINFDHSADMSVRPCIAVLAASDTITFFTTFVGMFRGGIPFFPISPRNSPAAIAHLLKATRPTHLFISVDAPIQELTGQTMALLEEAERPVIAAMPLYEEIYTGEKEFEPLPPRPRDLSATSIIAHSSGSTSFPKPIYWTDRTCGQASMAPWNGVRSYTGKIFAVHCLAMFHAIGINFMNWMSTTGLVLAVFAPASPATIPTIDAVYKGMVDVDPDFGFAPPIFIEMWSKDPAKVKVLKNLREGICFGGAPMNKLTGDFLAGEGVTLYSVFGITEAGVLCKHTPERTGMNWEYLEMNPFLATDFDPQDDGTYELIIISKPWTEIHVKNTKWKGEDAYASSDLFLPHPTLPGLWKLVGRKDDQLMLSTGEKTNPTPLESILSHDPHVTAGLMFGRGKFQNGLLVQLKPEFAFDPKDEAEVIKYRNLIWPSIEKMNEFAPSHSRLFKEMIIFTNPSKPFSFNAKGAPRRSVVLSEYDREIEALYATVEEKIEETHPETWTYEASLSFIRDVVNKNLDHPAKDDEDIFECGCDSLQAAWIRNTIVHALRDTQPAKARAISTNFVYEYARIDALAKFVTKSEEEEHEKEQVSPIDAMRSMLDQLAPSGSFSLVQGGERPASPATVKRQNILAALFSRFSSTPSEVVLITGTTGGLGAATLAKLVKSKTVRKVYAFNRPSKGGVSLKERMEKALSSKGYDAAIASSPKVVLVEAVITGEGLGVDAAFDREIRESVTQIIHIAWNVNFNLKLSSFDGLLKGMRTLIDLALTSPLPHTPRFVFSSSVGVLRGVPTGVAAAEIPLDDPEIAVGQGYSESKWVAEQMLYRAAKETCLRPVIARVGQIAGGPNGGWNTSDWVPAIVKSSVVLGGLPEFKGPCTWIPLDTAASAIVDFTRARETIRTVHLVHPKTQLSKTVFGIMGKELDLPLISYGDWVGRLKECTSDAGDVPALRLLNFFEAGLETESKDHEAVGIPAIACDGAKQTSGHLHKAQSISASEVKAWLDYWKSIGFLSA